MYRVVYRLFGFGLRQALGDVTCDVIDIVKQHFENHSTVLGTALTQANDRAWQALAAALAGDGLLSHLRDFLAGGDDKAVRDQIRRFLQSQASTFDKTPGEFRKACLEELQRLRKDRVLTADRLDTTEVARQAAAFSCFAEPEQLVEGARSAANGVADALAGDYPSLAQLLRQPTPGGPPLLVAAFAYFFRREIVTNAELARGLTLDNLEHLSAAQSAGFAAIKGALDELGNRFENLLSDSLQRWERIEKGVLDIQEELRRQGSSHQEVRLLIEQILKRLERLGMQWGEILPQHSFSIRGEDERRAVKQLLNRFRQLSPEEQRQLPAVLNGLGKLQVGAGDFPEARKTFDEVARTVSGSTARAEACFNAYRTALEERKWDEALAALRQAVDLDPPRFAPFPMDRYACQRILGAGGFGTAFLCHDANFGEDVVVKALHPADIDRSMDEVFGEARVLRQLSHPSIIGVRDCDYVDRRTRANPYIVMEYFPGTSLGEHLRPDKKLSPNAVYRIAWQIACGMEVVHARGILHRDLKPDNVLIRPQGDGWMVKIIDFGLALRSQTVETSRARASDQETILGNSVAGTLDYAAPEQLGRLFDASGKCVPVGFYSDVYSFGKLCCFALFRTSAPTSRNWEGVPQLKAVLEKCIEPELEHRWPSFGLVRKALEALGGRPPKDKQAESARTSQSTQGTEQAPRTPKPEEGITNSLGMKFAPIPPGTFLMGSPAHEKSRSDDELQHEVTLTKGFYLGVHLVTRGQFARFVHPTSYITEAERERCSHYWTGKEFAKDADVNWRSPGFDQTDHHPVVCVSWNDAVAFCKWLTQSDGRGKLYGLPTEAQWEYACRAGTTTAFYLGNTITPAQANFHGNYTAGKEPKSVYREQTTPVGSFPANSWGLCDMHGNAWEWCQDWYGPYPSGNVTDPERCPSGSRRVMRGGGWDVGKRHCRSANRNSSAPSLRFSTVGFRVCLPLD
jgi:formylglycine-generating enzyme required for sulfatase activity/tRNA A-37 threonylcarbamoyl transferase component Bud32